MDDVYQTAILLELAAQHQPLGVKAEAPLAARFVGLLHLMPIASWAGSLQPRCSPAGSKECGIEAAPVVRLVACAMLKTRRGRVRASVRFPGSGLLFEKPDPSKWGNWCRKDTPTPGSTVSSTVKSLRLRTAPQ